jgi:4'-phosphopantetheinyl transferase
MSAGVISEEPSLRWDAGLLTHDTICLWWANLDWAQSSLEAAWPGLSADERERAGRYHRSVDRARFIAARACLRNILSLCLDVSADAIRFECGEHEKPRLTSDFAESSVHFNVSHSQELAVFAVSLGREIGVDLECVDPNINCVEIARHVFAPEEQQALKTFAGEDQIQAFYRCWTRKEAYVKAIGSGLSLPLDSFVVSLLPTDFGQCVAVSLRDDLAYRTKHCSLIDISPDSNFAGTLAILSPNGSEPRIVQLSWS